LEKKEQQSQNKEKEKGRKGKALHIDSQPLLGVEGRPNVYHPFFVDIFG
jgi:hypothetical protein